MRIHTVTYTPTNINFMPASTLEEIYQNVHTIISTVKFTVPLNRGFGLKSTFIDKPVNQLHPLYVAEVIETVEKYEPRVLVEEVQMSAEIDGIAYPVVLFSIREDVNLNA